MIIETQGAEARLAAPPVFDVPTDSYVLLGDNRDNAVDSRQPQAYRLGFVPFENFVGRAEIIPYALEADLNGPAPTSRWRWDRMLQPVQQPPACRRPQLRHRCPLARLPLYGGARQGR